MERPPIRVLVAEDHPELLRRISRFVDNMPGMTCVGAVRDGRAAVDAATDLAPDVVLMDLRMPELDGVSATEEITKGGLRSRVIALTVFDDDATFHRALLAGVSGFVLKSSSRDDIADAIRQVYDGESVLSPSLMTRVLARYESSLEHPDEISHLTEREVTLLGCVGRGLSNDEIADEMTLSPHTVKSYISRLLTKVHCRDRAQLAILAHRSGVVTR